MAPSIIPLIRRFTPDKGTRKGLFRALIKGTATRLQTGSFGPWLPSHLQMPMAMHQFLTCLISKLKEPHSPFKRTLTPFKGAKPGWQVPQRLSRAPLRTRGTARWDPSHRSRLNRASRVLGGSGLVEYSIKYGVVEYGML